jgi:hypothetical protein
MNTKTKKMKTLSFNIDIKAGKQKVWDTMLGAETFKEWTNVSWPGSYYKGQWKKGENIRFVSSSGEGTVATIAELIPYNSVVAEHVAVLNSDGTEDRDSEVAKGWVGTTEAYKFDEQNGKTTLQVKINTNPAWEEMFTAGWPDALVKLKELCEK